MPIDKVSDPQVLRIFDDMKERYHSPLVACEVTIGLEWVSRREGDDSGKPLLKLHGVPCAAIVRITSEENRRWGAPDAVIKIDRDWWQAHDDEEREALADHEMEHLELARDSDDVIKSDDLGRPLLKMKPHDMEFGWFASIARRHGSKSNEVRQAVMIRETYGQLLFLFSDEVITTSRTTLSFNGGPPLPFDGDSLPPGIAEHLTSSFVGGER